MVTHESVVNIMRFLKDNMNNFFQFRILYLTEIGLEIKESISVSFALFHELNENVTILKPGSSNQTAG